MSLIWPWQNPCLCYVILPVFLKCFCRKSRGRFDIFAHTVLHFITTGEGWWAVYHFKTGTRGWSILAAGKSVFFYTDLPESKACILLFGLFFNLGCSFVGDWDVQDPCGKGFSGLCRTEQACFQAILKIIYEKHFVLIISDNYIFFPLAVNSDLKICSLISMPIKSSWQNRAVIVLTLSFISHICKYMKTSHTVSAYLSVSTGDVWGAVYSVSPAE